MNPRGHPIPVGRGGRRAFTLIELGISSALMGVLMVSMASVVVLASKAIPDPGSAAEAGGTNTLALDHLMTELRCATEVTAATATSVEFLIPDRTGDATPEKVGYEWDGPGEPLKRSYNDSEPFPISRELQSFKLEYSRRKVTTTETTTTTWDSGEVLFASFNGWSGLLTSQSSMNVTGSAWMAETFIIDKVSFPADVSRVAISRVSIVARRPFTPNGATLNVGIHRPTSSGGTIPAATPIGSTCLIPIATVPTSFGWVDATFSDVVFSNANETRFCVLIKGSGTSTAAVRYYSATLPPADQHWFRSTSNSGSSWSSDGLLDSNDMSFFVYGSYQRPITGTSTTHRYYLKSVTATMQTGAESGSRFDAGAEALNKPAIPAP